MGRLVEKALLPVLGTLCAKRGNIELGNANGQIRWGGNVNVEGYNERGKFMADQVLTHIDEKGDVRMVDVSQKADTERVAVAEGYIFMQSATLDMIAGNTAKKGDVLACARVAGVMAAKRTSDLIPMCHPLNITKAKVECTPVFAGEREDGRVGIHVTCTCGVTGKTGIEMEALTAASVACLTVYDMCKAVDRGMEITDVRLLKKDGGKTGLWLREGCEA